MTDSNNNSANSNGTPPPPQVIGIPGIPINTTTNWIPGQYLTYVAGGWNVAGAPPTVATDPVEVVMEKKKEKSVGCSCRKCKDFSEYAEPNQLDGTFMCYRCRKGL